MSHHGLFVLSTVRAVRVLIKDALVSLGLCLDSTMSLLDHSKVYKPSKAKLEALPKASEDKLSASQHRVREFEVTNEAVDQLVNKIDKAKKSSVASQERV